MPQTRSLTNEEGGGHREKQIETGRSEKRGNTRKNGTMGLSYRGPSRSYGKCLKWTYEMNKGIYKLYLAANPRQIKYKKTKALWDEKYSVYNGLTAKHPAEQVRNIKKKKLMSGIEINAIETELEKLPNNEFNNQDLDLEHQNDEQQQHE